MIELKPTEWPPLIRGAVVPLWIRARDVVLTLLAWGALAWVLRHGLELTIDYLTPPRFQFTSLDPPNLVELAVRLSGFLIFIAVSITWLCFWAIVRGGRLRANAPVPQPPGLSLQKHSGDFSLSQQTVAPWREAKVLVVHFDDQGRISGGDVKQPG